MDLKFKPRNEITKSAVLGQKTIKNLGLGQWSSNFFTDLKLYIKWNEHLHEIANPVCFPISNILTNNEKFKLIHGFEVNTEKTTF